MHYTSLYTFNNDLRVETAFGRQFHTRTKDLMCRLSEDKYSSTELETNVHKNEWKFFRRSNNV